MDKVESTVAVLADQGEIIDDKRCRNFGSSRSCRNASIAGNSAFGRLPLSVM